MQESSTDLRGFGLLPLAMKERHLLKADVSLSFRRCHGTHKTKLEYLERGGFICN